MAKMPMDLENSVAADRSRLSLGILRSAYLTGVSSGSTTTYTIPDDLYSSTGVYILAVANSYGVGSVSILRITTSQTKTIKNTDLISSTYFVFASIDDKHFKITASGATANSVSLTRIA